MKEAREIDWLRWFYRNAESIPEKEREELEERFYREEGMVLPKKYRVDEVHFVTPRVSNSGNRSIIKGLNKAPIYDYEQLNETGKKTKGIE